MYELRRQMNDVRRKILKNCLININRYDLAKEIDRLSDSDINEIFNNISERLKEVKNV